MANFSDLIFSQDIIPELEEARGHDWQIFIQNARGWLEGSNDQIACTLMLARLNSCTTCSANSYRAAQGCPACTRQTLRRYRGQDEELIQLHQTTLGEVEIFIRNHDFLYTDGKGKNEFQ